MSFDNFMNIGADISVLFYIAFLLAVTMGIGYVSVWIARTFFDYDKMRYRYFLLAWAIASVLWGLFGAFGPGKPLGITPAEDDGVNALLEDVPPEPTREEIEDASAGKKDDVLKQVEENFASPGGEDEYIKHAIERARKMEDKR